MRLENLYTNLLDLSEDALISHIRQYRALRTEELVTVKELVTRKSSAITLSPEEKALCKKLGLSAKDIMSLRSINTTPENEEDDDDADVEE